jgi:glycosyltransferase involved in cell wall biosynthesis
LTNQCLWKGSLKWSKELQAEKNPNISIIVPTLNEENNIRTFLESIGKQPSVDFETVIIDGGSNDETPKIAEAYNAKIVVLPGYGEFISRNIGAKIAKGSLLLFTCADIIFPKNVFRKIVDKFEKYPQLIALSGPGLPFETPFMGRVEYAIYDISRYLLAKLPKPLKRFSTSTNFLVVRKDYFEKTGGFLTDDINADGLMGRKLLDMGEVDFFMDTNVYASGRRMKNMGFIAFNRHYLYALENVFFFTSNIGLTKSIKLSSKMKHRKMHEV